MAYHEWGDKGVDWDGINDAANFIGSYCRRWGRLGGHAKEKYGEVRFYASFGYLSLHTLVYPGYVYCQFPKWLWAADIYYIGPFLQFCFGRLFSAWQIKVYKRAYALAIKKWPHLRSEILDGADYCELLSEL